MSIEMIQNEVRKYLKDNDWQTSEFDTSINDLSKKLVKAMQAEYGTAWLGRINFYRDSDMKDGEWFAPIMWKFDGNLNNFAATFVVPVYDAELVGLIEARRDSKYTGTKDDMTRIKAIFARLEALGGKSLHWS